MREPAGYQARGEQGIEGRFAFRQGSAYTPLSAHKRSWQNHHLYVCYRDSLALKNHLLFRDMLLRNKELADQYAKLKISLAQQRGTNRELYTKSKTDFIVNALAAGGLSADELLRITNDNI